MRLRRSSYEQKTKKESSCTGIQGEGGVRRSERRADARWTFSALPGSSEPDHGNVLPGKMFFLQILQEVTPGTVFFQMEIHQDVHLIFKRHFQGPVASREQGGDVGQYVVDRCHKVHMGLVFFSSFPGYPRVGHWHILRNISQLRKIAPTNFPICQEKSSHGCKYFSPTPNNYADQNS